MNAPLPAKTLRTIRTPGRKPVAASLCFRRSRGKTHLSHQLAPHPFHITRPFYMHGDPEGMATLYLQSSAGGLYNDDDHSLAIRVENQAKAHVTSQASTIVHAGHNGETRLSVDLDVGTGGCLEFCPDPAILFPTARLKSSVNARVGRDSVLMVCDAQLAHDPEERGSGFDYLDNEIRLSDTQGNAFFADRTYVTGENWINATGGYACAGTFLFCGSEQSTAVSIALEACIAGFDPSSIYAGQTFDRHRSVALVRLLAATGADLTRALQTLWMTARVASTGELPVHRKK
ncbi:MAG: urease accessory protein UreD [Roseibium sp.]|uniref:urease accessory protein UreD n=1 Tax=Roseibium sp. TaxID=1936156 RepID=UPI003D9BFFAE